MEPPGVSASARRVQPAAARTSLYPVRAIRRAERAAESRFIAAVRPTLRSYPVVVFALSRGLVWIWGALAVLLVAPDRSGNRYHPAGLAESGWPVDVWANWDGTWYARIAEHGYAGTSTPAFFPLYPYLSRALGWTLGGHVVLGSVLVSLAACLASFVLLHRLTTDLAGREAADRAVLYLAVFPTALFLQAAYAESLFLALALATFVLAERRRLEWAGVACGLALLTRPAGIAVVAALVVFAARQRGWKRGAVAVAVSLGLFCVFPAMLWAQHRNPLAFASAQHHWGRQFSPLGPLVALVESVAMTVVYVVTLFGAHEHTRKFVDFQRAAFNNVVAFVFLVMFFALLKSVYRRFGARSPYFVYAAASLAMPLFSPISGNPLLSLPRFGLMIFPFFVVLAMSGPRRLGHTAYVAASSALLAVASVAFAMYAWVA